MKPIWLFMIGLLLACCCCSHQAAPNVASSAAVDDLVSKTVALVSVDEDGAQAFCTGVWVGESSILTAAHCLEGCDGRFCAFATKDSVFASADLHVKQPMAYSVAVLSAVDMAHDLALLQNSASPPHAIAHVAWDVYPGARVQTMGHPLGLWFSYSSGDVASIRLLDLDGEGERAWVQATPPISPGNSGGGLFDSDGNLVGLAIGVLTRGQQLNLFAHPQYIDAFLRKQSTL